jgi:hypothetical protein
VKRFKAVLAALVAVAALLAVGCGGGGGDDDATASALTKSVLLNKSELICKEVPNQYAANLKQLTKKQLQEESSPPMNEEEKLVLLGAVPALQDAVEEFEQLTPPEAQEEEFDAIIAALEKAVKELEEDPGRESTGPNSPFTEFDELSKSYGLAYCGGF